MKESVHPRYVGMVARMRAAIDLVEEQVNRGLGDDEPVGVDELLSAAYALHGWCEALNRTLHIRYPKDAPKP